jgi:hypothetical protein
VSIALMSSIACRPSGGFGVPLVMCISKEIDVWLNAAFTLERLRASTCKAV